MDRSTILPDIPDISQQVQSRLKFERLSYRHGLAFSNSSWTALRYEDRFETDEFRVNAHSAKDSSPTRLTPEFGTLSTADLR